MANDYSLNHKNGLSKNKSISSDFSRLGQVESSNRGSQTDHKPQLGFQWKAKGTSTSHPEELRDLHLFVPNVRIRYSLFLNVIDYATKRSIKRLVSHNLMHVPH